MAGMTRMTFSDDSDDSDDSDNLVAEDAQVVNAPLPKKNPSRANSAQQCRVLPAVPVKAETRVGPGTSWTLRYSQKEFRRISFTRACRAFSKPLTIIRQKAGLFFKSVCVTPTMVQMSQRFK